MISNALSHSRYSRHKLVKSVLLNGFCLLGRHAMVPRVQSQSISRWQKICMMNKDRFRRDAGIQSVDLFCGAGGLTRGLREAGIRVSLGIDIDPVCEYPYTVNNQAAFRQQSVERLCGADFTEAFEGAALKLLAGCAPCQPFSTYSQKRTRNSARNWNLLAHFARLVRESQPHLVTMENVPRLRHQAVFADFVAVLRDEGFAVCHRVVNGADYGVPQRRRRLVLLASRLGAIHLIEPSTPAGRPITVRDVMGHLPPLAAGEACTEDPLHQASALSPLNLRRIRASRPGGSWRDWDASLRAACHRKASGQTYASVYGRMTWDQPSPTITTQYYGFGNGRFGHPEQDRALSLREGAILQGFPEDYRFVPREAPIHAKTIGRLVGNAVPVALGRAIGNSLVRHVKVHAAAGGRDT